jgi:hypothetical protein
LDGDFDSENEWVQIMRPLRDIVLKSQGTKPQQPTVKPQQPTTQTRPQAPASRPQAPTPPGTIYNTTHGSSRRLR